LKKGTELERKKNQQMNENIVIFWRGHSLRKNILKEGSCWGLGRSDGVQNRKKGTKGGKKKKKAWTQHMPRERP